MKEKRTRKKEAGEDTCAGEPSRHPLQVITSNVTERTFSLKHQAVLVSMAKAIDGYVWLREDVRCKVVMMRQRKRGGGLGLAGQIELRPLQVNER